MTITKESITSLADRAVYLVLDWSFLGTWRHVETADTNSEVRASKRIVKASSISAMRRLHYKVRAALSRHALNSLFRPGVYVIPLDNIKTVDAVLQDAVVEMNTIKEEIIAEWPSIFADGRERLGNLFDPSDYCSALAAAGEFDMGYRYVPIAQTPDILKHLAADTYKADLDRTRKETEKELETFRQGLRVTLLEIVENMRKTLTKPDGEKRVFGQRFFKRLDEFLDTFGTKNLSDDGALQAVVTQLRQVADGTDISNLKESTDVQIALQESLQDISESMTALMIDDGERLIDFSMAS